MNIKNCFDMGKIYITYADELTEREALNAALAVVTQIKPKQRKGVIETNRSRVYIPERTKHLTMQITKKNAD